MQINKKKLKKHNSPKNVELTDHVPLFIKFVDNDYYQNFVHSGQLHFGTLKAFRDRALPGNPSGSLDTVIGDSDEGVRKLYFGSGSSAKIVQKMKGSSIKTYKFVIPDNEYASFRVIPFPDAAIFSFTMVPRNQLYDSGDHQYKLKPEFIDLLESDFPKDEKTPVILRRVDTIWAKVSLITHQTSHARGPVSYYDNQDMAIADVKSRFPTDVPQDELVPFTKGLRYKKQNEYRFLLNDNKQLDGHGNLEIGSLLGLVEEVGSLREIVIQAREDQVYLTPFQIFQGLKYSYISDKALMEFQNSKLLKILSNGSTNFITKQETKRRTVRLTHH